MELSGKRVLVTGGAGFIGSHLVEASIREGAHVVVIDNLSSGRLANVERWFNTSDFIFKKGDLTIPGDVKEALEDCEVVFHTAANPEVVAGTKDTTLDFRQNLLATYNLLEGMRENHTAKTVTFTSTSTVYGDATVLPTPESYGPLEPISLYGASKLGCEALISAYRHTFNIRAVIYRLANIVGPRSHRGVIYDFVRKLRLDPMRLDILGDGTQRKSYLYIDDCIEAILLGLSHAEENLEVFNVGSRDQLDVSTIARIVCEEMRLTDVKFSYTGGVHGGRGWEGDVKFMFLDTKRLRNIGWRPSYNSREAVRMTVKALLQETS